jgi:hypothetical protein
VISIKVTTDFDGDSFRKKIAEALETKTRELIRNRLTFPGSNKLKITATIHDDKVSLDFVGPDEVVAEAKKRWKRG